MGVLLGGRPLLARVVRVTEPTSTPITYAGAGVDVEAGVKAVELVKD